MAPFVEALKRALDDCRKAPHRWAEVAAIARFENRRKAFEHTFGPPRYRRAVAEWYGDDSPVDPSICGES